MWGEGGLESKERGTGYESPFLGKTQPVCDGVTRVAIPGWGHIDTTLTGEAAAGPRLQTASGSPEVQPRDLPASDGRCTAPAAPRSPSVGFNQLGTSLKFKTQATAPLPSLAVYSAFYGSVTTLYRSQEVIIFAKNQTTAAMGEVVVALDFLRHRE